VWPLWPAAATGLAWLGSWPASWLVFVARRSAEVPSASLPWPSGVLPGLLLALGLAVGLVLLRWRVSRRFLLVALLGIAVGVTPIRLLNGSWPPPGWAMVVCDVGQGDALILPTDEDSRVVVVDAGPDPRAVDTCLRSLGADRVALLAFSHLHADHVNGISGVYSGRTVEAVMLPHDEEPEPGRHRVAEATRDTPAVEPRPGATVDLGRTSLTVVAPDTDFSGTRSDPNNNSLVLRVTVDGVSILLSGDIERPAQRSVLTSGIPLAADVLKVPHHGSSYFDADFFETVAPRLAVISVGEDNDYGHPHPKTLNQLREQRATVLRTDRDGSIAVVADDGELKVMTNE
ncbi:MAG: ComEC/Rec2 family competence protein, partial [Stackebrandtia sp.]